MNPRDLALIGAVVLLGGFAAADALRGDGGGGAETAGPATTTAPDRDDVRRRFPDVRAPGWLAFTDGDDCRLREASIATGLEVPLPPIQTTCDLWAPPQGQRVAVGIGSRSGEALPFRFVDLTHAERPLGASRTRFGHVAWSADGRWAAWCDVDRGALVLEVGERPREVPGCPRAVTTDGDPAYATGPAGALVQVDGRPLFTASGFVASLHPGVDGSWGVLAEGLRLERFVGGRLTASAALRADGAGRPAVFSPDNCAALLLLGVRIRLVDLPCFRGRDAFTNVSPDNCAGDDRGLPECARFPAPRTFDGTAAAWSPDGDWIAVAEGDAIAFHRVVGRYEVVRWEVTARQLAWLG